MADEQHFSCALDQEHSEFTVFVQAHLNSYFLPLARRYAGSTMLDAAPDLAQGALAIAWSRWWVDLDMAPCWRRCGFVCKTMSNLAHEERRGRHRAGTPTDPQSFPDTPSLTGSPEDRYIEGEVARAVETAMAALTLQERLIIDLAIAKLPHAQIADLLGISRTNVSTRLRRARVRLAQQLDSGRVENIGLRVTTDPSGGVA